MMLVVQVKFDIGVVDCSDVAAVWVDVAVAVVVVVVVVVDYSDFAAVGVDVAIVVVDDDAVVVVYWSDVAAVWVDVAVVVVVDAVVFVVAVIVVRHRFWQFRCCCSLDTNLISLSFTESSTNLKVFPKSLLFEDLNWYFIKYINSANLADYIK